MSLAFELALRYLTGMEELEENAAASSACRSLGERYRPTEYPHRDVTDGVIGAAIEVHRRLGPGFLESCYEEALCVELDARRISYARQVTVRVPYRSVVVGIHRLDLMVAGKVVVEVKAVRDIDDAHLAVVLAYLKSTRLEVGLILNFSAAKLRVRRVASIHAAKAD